ncbi:MAG: hypothetical protein NC548_16925, partial [Lachnospiraceae bacterium]|nr:hypothetical protein [Lachnospiraceae bacterium]
MHDQSPRSKLTGALTLAAFAKVPGNHDSLDLWLIARRNIGHRRGAVSCLSEESVRRISNRSQQGLLRGE